MLDIDYAIARLREYNVTVESDSRLHQARAILSEAAASGTLIPLHRGDDLGLRALELAFDYAAISDTLPNRAVASVRRELSLSLAGPLDPPEDQRDPQRYQSQFVVRAAFVRAGLDPSHPCNSPRLGRSNPDLVLENGLSRYAVEVKRPRVTKNVIPRMTDAVDQLLDYGLKGGVLIDVTDCVRGLSPNDVGSEVRRLALTMYSEVFDDLGFRPGRSHVIVAGTFARVAWETTDYDAHAMVNVHTASTIGIFAQARGTLLDLRARWIRSAFERGLEQLYRTLRERTNA